MKRFREHTVALFKNTEDEIPWARMVICGLATAGPLAVGLLRGEISLAIYASLLGYLVALNDHLGTLWQRCLIGTLSFVVLIAAFALGLALHGHFSIFFVTTLALTYWLGLMGGLGAEVERLLLFAIIQLLIGFYAHALNLGVAVATFNYGLIAYAIIIAGMFVSDFILRGKTQAFAGLQESILSSLTLRRQRHLYAFSFLVTALLAILCVQYFAIERGYWTVVTVMLIMKPDQKESIYRSFQRFIGTLLGVFVGEATVVLAGNAEVLILGLMLCAFLVPYAMKRNYWMVSFFVSIVVMFLLSIPAVNHPDAHLPFLRLQATLYGCLISLTGVFIFRLLSGGSNKIGADEAAKFMDSIKSAK